MKSRHHLPPAGQVPLWHITVTSKDGAELIMHATGEDEKEIQALATNSLPRRGRGDCWQ